MAAKRRTAPVFTSPKEARAAFKEMCDLAEVEVWALERKFRMDFPHLRKRLAETRRALRQLAGAFTSAQGPALLKRGRAIVDRLGLGGTRG